LFPIAGGGMYVRNDITRFGAGSLPFNSSLDKSGIGGQFAQQYYQIYASNRAALAGIYRENSQLTFEGRLKTGVAGIMEEILKLPAGKHAIDSLDVHPVDSVTTLILVSGKIIIEGEENPLAVCIS
jgi:Nuclear transport factor 2 (NTF2) domain